MELRWEECEKLAQWALIHYEKEKDRETLNSNKERNILSMYK